MPWNDIPGQSTAGFLADPNSIRRSTGRQLNWNAMPDAARLGVQFVTLSALANSSATTLAVTALPIDVPIYTELYFGEVGEAVRVTAPAKKGDTTLTVEATTTAIESGDKAPLPPTGTVLGLNQISKAVAAGKIMSQLSDGTIVPREYTSVTASHIILEGHVQNSRTESLSGVGTIVGGVLFKQLLPDFANTNFATWIAELATNGCTFQWENYADTRAA